MTVHTKEEIKIGYSFSQEKVFSEDELIKLAQDCGDTNFIHHDIEKAKSTQFSGIIASGSAISALFSAMIPAHFSNISPMLGLEMSFKFPSPIKPNTELLMHWQVAELSATKQADLLLHLSGRITHNDNILVTAKAKILLLCKL